MSPLVSVLGDRQYAEDKHCNCEVCRKEYGANESTNKSMVRVSHKLLHGQL